MIILLHEIILSQTDSSSQITEILNLIEDGWIIPLFLG